MESILARCQSANDPSFFKQWAACERRERADARTAAPTMTSRSSSRLPQVGSSHPAAGLVWYDCDSASQLRLQLVGDPFMRTGRLRAVPNGRSELSGAFTSPLLNLSFAAIPLVVAVVWSTSLISELGRGFDLRAGGAIVAAAAVFMLFGTLIGCLPRLPPLVVPPPRRLLCRNTPAQGA